MPICQKCQEWGIGFHEACKKCKKLKPKQQKNKNTPINIEKKECNHFFSGWRCNKETGQTYKKCYKCGDLQI